MVLLAATCLIIATSLVVESGVNIIEFPQQREADSSVREWCSSEAPQTSSSWVGQRNMLSKKLNEMMKHYGQQSCDLKATQKKIGEKVNNGIVTDNGGFCSKHSRKMNRFDQGFARALSKFFKGQTVGSFGDGAGEYKEKLEKLKEVANYTAYDGAPYSEEITKGKVNFLDLTVPQFDLPAFDWVLSVEVGEHIPAKFEHIFLDNLVRHAKAGIVLSWATPGQKGISHVNTRPLAYVIAKMKEHGFRIDKNGGQVLRESAKFHWLQKNVHIYRRIDPTSFRTDFT